MPSSGRRQQLRGCRLAAFALPLGSKPCITRPRPLTLVCTADAPSPPDIDHSPSGLLLKVVRGWRDALQRDVAGITAMSAGVRCRP